jgi:hypothetical protein
VWSKNSHSWDTVVGTVHQRMASAKREREGDSWTNRSIGGVNGRHALVCRVRGIGVRYNVIPYAREYQMPERPPRDWGCSLSRAWTALWAWLAGSITGVIMILRVLACFPSSLAAASCGAGPYAGTGGVTEGHASIDVCVAQKKYPFPELKSPTIVVMIRRKKANN